MSIVLISSGAAALYLRQRGCAISERDLRRALRRGEGGLRSYGHPERPGTFLELSQVRAAAGLRDDDDLLLSDDEAVALASWYAGDRQTARRVLNAVARRFNGAARYSRAALLEAAREPVPQG